MAIKKTNLIVCIRCRFTVIPSSFQGLFESPGLAAPAILKRRSAAQMIRVDLQLHRKAAY
jgi:hypothetical protein